MKIMKFAMALLLTSSLTACSQVDPLPPDQLVANMAPVLEVEQRVDQMRFYTKLLESLGGISEGKTKELKKHFDIYYVYYLASNVHLAKGDTESYLAHIRLADRELDAIEGILKDGLAKQSEPESSGESQFSRPNL